MITVIIYLLSILLLTILSMVSPHIFILPDWYMNNLLFAKCTYFGTLAGVLYCLRAIYVNKAVYNRWSSEWLVWYYLRPITSSISGFISCIFLKTGLLVLDASMSTENSTYGFYAVAFIAGYNVDNFMKKIESIAQTVWGIEKSNAAAKSDKQKK